MNPEKQSELLSALTNKFDDYLDYYDLMGCLPGISESRIETLKDCRTRNGLGDISYFSQIPNGKLMVSAAGFEGWVLRNFRKAKSG